MLSRPYLRLLRGKPIDWNSARCGASTLNIRKYYGDPQAINYLSQQLQQRRLLMRRQEPAEIALNLQMKKKLSRRWEIFAWGKSTNSKLFFTNITQWKEEKLHEQRLREQNFDAERHEILGNDLSAAHFVLHQCGKVRFKGHTNWIMPTKSKKNAIPKSFDPNYVIEALDLSETTIEYEGLLNISSLIYLKWLSFQGSPTISDWSLDRISTEYPNLEYLDVSKCNAVTERGLEALYRMPNLKTLVVTNHYNSPAFELTCYMLEDVNPNLKCDIRDPQNRPIQSASTDE